MSKIAARWRQREAEGLTARERGAGRAVERAKREAPAYPSTPQALESELMAAKGPWLAEEKLDGANCGVWLQEGRAMVRDRTRALRKGVEEGGWGKRQFAPLWERAQRAVPAIEGIERRLGMRVAIYGEWMLLAHGRLYRAVPELWRPWAIWSVDASRMVDPWLARALLVEFGLAPPAKLGAWDPSMGWAAAQALAVGESELGGPREGAVLKAGDGVWQLAVSKIVAPGFAQGALWDSEAPTRQPRRA